MMIRKIKAIIWLALLVLTCGCRLVPNQPGVLPTQMTEEVTLVPQIDETQTVTITSSPNFTVTPQPTAVLYPTATQYPFRVQANSPVYIQKFTHTEDGCNWLGIAGQVFGKTGQPVVNQVVVVKGQIADRQINSVTLTGLDSATQYGPGGYEVLLYSKTIATQGMIAIQLFDTEGHPQTPPVFVDTFNDCSKNLIIFNFEYINASE